MTRAKFTSAAMCAATLITMPNTASAQPAVAPHSPSTWDFALTGSKTSEPFDNC